MGVQNFKNCKHYYGDVYVHLCFLAFVNILACGCISLVYECPHILHHCPYMHMPICMCSWILIQQNMHISVEGLFSYPDSTPSHMFHVVLTQEF